MRKILLLLALTFSGIIIAQQGQPHVISKPRTLPLPQQVYTTMRDSCNYLDIVFITGKGGSMSLDNARSIRGFTSFVTTMPAEKKPNAPLDGTLMWQINGKEYQSGSLFFNSDSSAYIVFQRNNKEYVNALSPDGAGFLRNRGGK